jgi:hypothetical protein
MRMGGQRHVPAGLPPGKTRYLLYKRLGWASGPVWTGTENLASTGIRSPERPARSESLYRLSYRGPYWGPPSPNIRGNRTEFSGLGDLARDLCNPALFFNLHACNCSVCLLMSLYSFGSPQSIRDEAAATNMSTWEVATGGWPKLCNEGAPPFLFFFLWRNSPIRA